MPVERAVATRQIGRPAFASHGISCARPLATKSRLCADENKMAAECRFPERGRHGLGLAETRRIAVMLN